jgi:CHAD domain-containing protein
MADNQKVTKNHREIELKYDLPSEASLPDLTALPGVTSVESQEHDLVATYFDTADLRLAANQLILRRRSGGMDDGWHIKLPAVKGARDEFHHPLGRAVRTVPKGVAALVSARTRGRPLRPVVNLRTHRTAYQLRGADGIVRAEVAHDRVVAEGLLDGATSATWQELEVELVDGDQKFLDTVAKRLKAAGLQLSPATSKFARALGDRLPGSEDSQLTTASPAGAVIVARLRILVDALINNDPRVRRDLPDSIHQMRVATRRLRSALRTFRPLFDRSRTDPLRAELRWLATELGEARDREVMLARLQKRIAAEPPELVLGRVAERVQIRLAHEYREAHDRVLGELDEARYRQLLDDLDALIADPQFLGDAHRPARDVLPKLVGKSWKRLRRRVQEAKGAENQETRDVAMHEARKEAKQARYAGEAVTSVFGDDADTFASAMENIQELLGDHQDSVVTRALLRELGVQAFLDGENGFTYGRLHAHEEARAADLEKEFWPVWKASSNKKLRAWLR